VNLHPELTLKNAGSAG